ncbi:hypothetical protein pb186bvf_002420 [Paramecium bursaria]
MSAANDCMKCYKQILKNLDMPESGELKDLQNEKVYCEMFKIMFPFLEQDVNSIQKEKNPVGEKLQGLIEILSYPILSMDLSHISGKDIANGDSKHLLNLLQILKELSKLYAQQQNNSETETPYSNNQRQLESQSHNNSAPLIRDQYQNNRQEEEDEEELQDEEDEDIPRQIQEDSQSEETPKAKQIKRNKSQKDLSSKKKEGKKEIVNNKENQLKALEENIIPKTYQQHRIITTDPNLVQKSKKTVKKQKQPQKQQDFPGLEDISEVDLSFLDNVDQEELNQLPEDDETRMKYERELQKLQIFKMAQESQGSPNFDEMMDMQIEGVKKNFNLSKQKPPLDEQETLNQILKKKNDYKLYLKEHLQRTKQKEYSLKKNNDKQKKQMTKTQKKIVKEQQDLKKEFENQHLSVYYQMRDEKLNYLRKIHRIIFELEKRKIIDEKKEHLQTRRQQNIIARNALTSIENAYNDKISMLREKLQNERKERQQSGVVQREVNIQLSYLVIIKIREGTQIRETQIDRLNERYSQIGEGKI